MKLALGSSSSCTAARALDAPVFVLPNKFKLISHACWTVLGGLHVECFEKDMISDMFAKVAVRSLPTCPKENVSHPSPFFSSLVCTMTASTDAQQNDANADPSKDVKAEEIGEPVLFCP
jgi:hypothetical protein